ncbi:MAG: polyamine aminopropyltransferase [Pseudomonadales bacterium]|nr:polyamine aminopropyltransferase [Pseudomonadales bacterium]
MERFIETLYDSWGQQYSIDKIYFENKTDHQHLMIFHNARFGRVMALDGAVQTTEKDEFIYHEMMTHVPILAHGNVRRVLIIGGGDGGMLREVLRHPGIEHVTQVEIDQQVIEMCKTYFPKHSCGAYDDPRVNIVIDDGLNFIKTNTEKFDIVITDCTDPIGPGESLFTSSFYEGCANALTEEGIFVAQNGVCFMQLDEVTTTAKRLAPYFADCHFYNAAVPTYVGGAMTFAWASHNPVHRTKTTDIIEKNFKNSGIKTRFYNPALHVGSFALPQYVLEALQS